MILLVLGLLLWIAAHSFRRAAPDQRHALQDKMGEGSKGVIAGVILLSVVLMVVGYRGADGTYFWGRETGLTGLNNLMMLLVVALFGLGNSKSRLRARMRHPMLAALALWAVAHLMVNGDTPSFVLFGGLGLWAVAEMVMINRSVPEFAPFEGGTGAGDVRLVVISLVVFTVIAGIHTWLGYLPFGG